MQIIDIKSGNILGEFKLLKHNTFIRADDKKYRVIITYLNNVMFARPLYWYENLYLIWKRVCQIPTKIAKKIETTRY